MNTLDYIIQTYTSFRKKGAAFDFIFNIKFSSFCSVLTLVVRWPLDRTHTHTSASAEYISGSMDLEFHLKYVNKHIDLHT